MASDIPGVAVVSVDSLANGYRPLNFAGYLSGRGHFDRSVLKRMSSEWDSYEYSCSRGYDCFERTMDIMTYLFGEGIAGQKKEHIKELGRDFSRVHGPDVFPGSQELVRRLYACDFRTLAVSESPIEAVAPLARELGFDRTYATRYASSRGVYTGRVKKSYTGTRSGFNAVQEFLDRNGPAGESKKTHLGRVGTFLLIGSHPLHDPYLLLSGMPDINAHSFVINKEIRDHPDCVARKVLYDWPVLGTPEDMLTHREIVDVLGIPEIPRKVA
jgi:hypothetical protein